MGSLDGGMWLGECVVQGGPGRINETSSGLGGWPRPANRGADPAAASGAPRSLSTLFTRQRDQREVQHSNRTSPTNVASPEPRVRLLRGRKRWRRHVQSRAWRQTFRSVERMPFCFTDIKSTSFPLLRRYVPSALSPPPAVVHIIYINCLYSLARKLPTDSSCRQLTERGPGR